MARLFKLGLLTSVALTFLPAAAWAQTTSPKPPAANAGAGTVEEIVVTAEKRNENIQDVPIAVSAVSASTLSRAHIASTLDLAILVPGLSSYQGEGLAQPHIRGIGNTVPAVGIENSIATYVDGVYIGSMSGALFSLAGVDRVEVDKGPQGTLFGRNATGGVVQIITKEPSSVFGGDISAGYGNFNTVNANLYVTGGLAENLAASFAAYFNDRLSGYGHNLYNGDAIGIQNDLALRSKLLWTPTAKDNIELSVDYESSSGNQYVTLGAIPGYSNVGLPPLSNPYDINSNIQPNGWMRQGGVALDIEHDFSFAKLVSITAYRTTQADTVFGYSLFPTDIGGNIGQSYSQESEELRLVSAPSSPVKWVVGAFYLNAPASSDPFNLIGDFLPVIARLPANPITNNTVTDQSEAIYGQATFPVPMVPRTNLTLGIRYTAEQRSIYGNVGLIGLPLTSFRASQNYSAPTWHFALDHHFTDDLMGYVSVGRGFKAGTFDGNATSVLALTTPVGSETLDAYEAGLKSEFLDRRVQLNVAGFYYNYSNIQIPQYTGTGVTVLSGPKAEVYGADFDGSVAITKQLMVRLGLSLLHTDFTSFPNAPLFAPGPGGVGIIEYNGSATGNQLPVSPNVTFDISATYNIPLSTGATLSINGTYYYKGKFFVGPDNDLAVPSSNLLDASLGWTSPSGDYGIELWVNNLLNEAIVASRSESKPWGDFEEMQPPLTFGVTLHRHL